MVAKFTSDDSPQPLSNFSASIVWGDGHTTAIADIVNDPTLPGVFDVLGTNTYAKEGTYPVTVSIEDAPPLTTPSFAVAASIATIADAPLSATGISTPPVLPQGQIVAGVPTFSGTVATFTDADPAGTLTDYTATINWGDGVSVNGVISGPVAGVFFVTGSHTFTTAGSYPVSVFIKDVGGSSATAVTTFTITGTTPVVAPIAPATLTEIEGRPFTAPIGASPTRTDRDDERIFGHHQLGRHDDLTGHGLSTRQRHVRRDRVAHLRRRHHGHPAARGYVHREGGGREARSRAQRA